MSERTENNQTMLNSPGSAFLSLKEIPCQENADPANCGTRAATGDEIWYSFAIHGARRGISYVNYVRWEGGKDGSDWND